MNKEFKKNGYCLLKNAINSDLRDVLTQYALFDEMQDFSSGFIQVPDAHSKYADPAMEAMLLYLHPKIERCTGMNLHPTYSFYRVYRNGNELIPHTDRPSCEISATLCLNYSYFYKHNNGYDEYGASDSDTSYCWPIFMNGSKVVMEPGDMVVYRGIDLPHWREKFLPPEDAWHVQAFFHYVDSNGKNSSHMYDGRSGVGESKNTVTRHINKEKQYITYL